MKMIKQSIVYKTNLEYFAGYIQNIIDTTGVEASVSFEDKKIELLINPEDANAQEFSNRLSLYLPNSIYIGHIQTESVELKKIKKTQFTSKSYPTLSLCRECLEGEVTPESVCTHYSNQATAYQDESKYCDSYNDGDAVLIIDGSKIDTLFNMTKKEQELLFSIEKPMLKVTIKDEELITKTGQSFIYVKAQSSATSYLLTKKTDLPYLFFKPTEELKLIVVNDSISIVHDNQLSATLQNYNDDTVINRFINIQKEFGLNKGSIGLYANTQEISFVATSPSKTGRILEFNHFDANTELELLLSKRAKLIDNFNEKFPNILNTDMTNFTLFEVIATILDLEPTFEALSDKSLEFRGNGGVKIDTKYKNDLFDYGAFIGSIISFRLAGTPTHYIAYSVFESLADFFIIIYQESKSKIKVDDFIIFGDMFSNNVLYSRILSKMSVKKPYFSQMFALDE